MNENDIDDEESRFYDGECQGCDMLTRLNDLGLCEECSGKLERDLIRQRDWDYSLLAFGVPESKREGLRMHIIKQYGEKLELIEPTKEKKKRKKSRKKKRNNSEVG